MINLSVLRKISAAVEEQLSDTGNWRIVDAGDRVHPGLVIELGEPLLEGTRVGVEITRDDCPELYDKFIESSDWVDYTRAGSANPSGG